MTSTSSTVRGRHLGPGVQRRGDRDDGRGGPRDGDPRRSPADQRPVRRAAGSRGRRGPAHPAGQRRAEPSRPERRHDGARDPLGRSHVPDDRQHGGPHQVLRRVLPGRDQGGHQAGGDPGVGTGCPRLPAALARRHGGLRDRPAAGHRIQDPHAGRAGRHAHRRPARGGHRSARRLARRAARRRIRPGPADRVERRGPARLPAARGAGPPAGHHHRAQRTGQPVRHRKRAPTASPATRRR